ncbi:MAG TPA: NUDIX hydrolase N-terminal domain-containing protein [Bacilli bacterium]|jgi:8-oxo-dGTP diphosphatase|nr:NUDIX hydrolase N-terminal domain-containing protein [Bacilli bacterium]
MSEEKKLQIYDFIIQIQAIAKIGLKYSKDPYAIENYKKIEQISLHLLEDIQEVNFDRNNYFLRDIYPTPNISVRTCVFNNSGQVLLVKEKSDGGYSLPGGWCDLYDSPSIAAIRECKEEAGAIVKIKRLVGVLNRTPFKNKISVPEYVIIFEAELLEPLKGHDHEISEVHFFDVNKLPNFSNKVSGPEMKKIIKSAQKGDVIYD